jgi:hypothetical protein
MHTQCERIQSGRRRKKQQKRDATNTLGRKTHADKQGIKQTRLKRERASRKDRKQKTKTREDSKERNWQP